MMTSTTASLVYQAEIAPRVMPSPVPAKRKAVDEDRTTEQEPDGLSKENESGNGAYTDEAAFNECAGYFLDSEYEGDTQHIIDIPEFDENQLEIDHAASRIEREFDENGMEFYYAEMEYEDILADEEYDRIEADRIQRLKEDVYFNERIRASDTEVLDVKAEAGLCALCGSIRWSALARISLRYHHLLYSLRDSPFDLADSACKVCRFLGQIGLRRGRLPGSHDGKLDFDLYVTRTQEENRRVLALFIRGVSEGSLLTLHSPTYTEEWDPRIIGPKLADFKVLRRLLTFCAQNHKETCLPKGGVQLAGFAIIDCLSRKVVAAPADCKYVALSYVWGSSASGGTQERARNRYPATIEDSFQVCLKLGFRYLWVDRYCIDQTNLTQKHAQIQNMDEIYSKAQLTIIAAAGSSPAHGLPGAGSTPRTLQHHVKLGNTRLVQLQLPGADFPRSPWWTRAWTFQEGVLSKRRLLFTDHQVFFLCNNHNDDSTAHYAYAESLNVRTTPAATYTGPSSFSGTRAFAELLLPPGPRSYESYLRSITQRALSHQADALNACLGILKASHTPHVWGLPIDFVGAEDIATVALCWRQEAPSQRRTGFPSWSWAGWKSIVDFHDSTASGDVCAVRLGGGRQAWETPAEYVTSGRAQACAGRNAAPRLLKITGSVLDASVLDPQWPDLEFFELGATMNTLEGNPKPFFLLNERGVSGAASGAASVAFDEEMENSEQLRGIIAVAVKGRSGDACFSALLLRPKEEVYTRVGIMQLSCEDRACTRTPERHHFWGRRASRWTVVVE